MYGLEGILGNIITGAATPAIGAVIKDATSAGATDFAKGIFSGMDEKTAQTLGGITSGTLGAAGGALMGAGIGALTGGKRGAGMGALTGALGGGYGAYQSNPILQSLGMGQPAQQPPPLVPTEDPTSIMNQSMAQAAASANIPTTPQGITGQPLSQAAGSQAMGAPAQGQGRNQPQGQAQPAKEQPNYLQLAALPSLIGMQLGSSAQDMDYAARAKKHQQQQAAAQQAMLSQLIGGMYQPIGSYAAGGPLEIHGQGAVPSTVRIPASAADGFIRSGGIASLEDGYASGGFVNTANPQTIYPQSHIAKAQPYIAATPQRREVIGFAGGGLLEGDGDGMSDNIPANIDGQEDVRVADGEYVIPKEAAHGREAQLKAALTAVRKAAHPEHGQQIKQDAAKRAFVQVLSRVKM